MDLRRRKRWRERGRKREIDVLAMSICSMLSSVTLNSFTTIII